MNKTFRPYHPYLQICIFIHPNSPEVQKYPRDLYSFFTRDIKDPLSRGLGIPVLCWYSLPNNNKNKLKPINFESSKHTIIIALIDFKMVNDDYWSNYINDLWNQIKNQHKHRLIPVALDKSALKIGDQINKANFIRLYDQPKNLKDFYLKIQISNEISRILNLDKGEESQKIDQIKLFLSYAQIDGENIVEKFRNNLYKNTPLKAFFDAIDIPPGINFEKFIEKTVSKSCLIAFQTDNYASREWCRREILLSKDYGCPIIIVNCLKDGEDRIFPYMGNVPNIRWNQKKQLIFEILILALREILRNLYNAELLNDYLDYWNNNVKSLNWYRAPEILTCIQLQSKIKIEDYHKFIFPDPPLGIEEIKLLKKTLPKIIFMTPTQYLSSIRNSNIAGKRVGISISQSSDLPLNGLTLHHLNDVMIEFARYLLASNAIIAYGGDLRANGFTQILFDLSRKYLETSEKPKSKIINFLTWPFYRDLTEMEQAELKDIAIIKKIDLPVDLSKFSDIKLNYSQLNHKYLVARSLTEMRKEMNKFIDCRIIIGGKTTNFQGRYPGLVEEAYYAIKSKKPVYLIGAYGGAASTIIKAIKGKIPEKLTFNEQAKNEKYKKFAHYFNAQILNDPQITKQLIDYDEISQFFNKVGLNGLNNRLSIEENNQLFKTKNIFEMISLVLKGLSEI